MATRSQSCPALGLDLEASTTIIYKFFVRERSLIPSGLREGSKRSNQAADRKHAEEAVAAGQERAAMDSRVRPGRVDTGMAVYQNAERVRIGSVRSLLAREGFWLSDAYFFEKQARGNRPTDYVIVLVLSTENEEAMKLTRATMEGLRKLARENVWTTHVWDNSNLGNPSTANFTGRQQGKPSHELVVRDGFLRLETPEGKNAYEVETQEDAQIADELLAALEGIKL